MLCFKVNPGEGRVPKSLMSKSTSRMDNKAVRNLSKEIQAKVWSQYMRDKGFREEGMVMVCQCQLISVHTQNFIKMFVLHLKNFRGVSE